MESLDKKEKLNVLFDLYRPLLTERQVLFFELYYREDYSLSEISDLYSISRNAIFDHLKKVEDYLIDYENKLHLYALQETRKKLLEDYLNTQDETFLEELRKLDE